MLSIADPVPTLAALHRQWRAGTLFAVAVLLGAGTADLVRPRPFVATATLEMLPRPGHELPHHAVRDDDVRGYFEVLQQQRTLAQRIASPQVLADAASRLEHATAAELQHRVRVEPQPQSALVHVHIHHTEPTHAAAEANAVAQAAVRAMRDARRRDADHAATWAAEARNTSGLTTDLIDALTRREQELRLAARTERGPLQQVAEATPPSRRQGPSLPLSLALASLAALAGGLATVFVADALDDTVHSPEHAETLTGLPMIGETSPNVLHPLTTAEPLVCVGPAPHHLNASGHLHLAANPAEASLAPANARRLLLAHRGQSRRQLLRTLRALRALGLPATGLLWIPG